MGRQLFDGLLVFLQIRYDIIQRNIPSSKSFHHPFYVGTRDQGVFVMQLIFFSLSCDALDEQQQRDIELSPP